MNILRKIFDVISTIGLMILVLFINVGTILIIMEYIDYLKLSNYLSYFGIVFIILYFIGKIIKRDSVKAKDLIFISLSIFAFLSYYFAFDREMALYGVLNRHEGLYTILTYYSTFLLASLLPKKKQKVIMYTFLFTGIIQIIIGTIQTLRITNILGYDRSSNWSSYFKFASGTLGNPNFYSTYILLCLMYVYGCLLKSKRIINIIFYIILTIIFLYGLVIGNTSSCLIAFIVVMFVSILRKINKNNIKKVLVCGSVVIPIIISGVLVLDNFCNNRITFTMKKNINEVLEIINNGITDETGNHRVYIWRKTLEKVPKYIYTGIGLDNFSYINNGKYLCSGDTILDQCFDKAHNEHLQKLITEGIFSIIIYLILLCYVVYNFYKNKRYLDNHFYGIYLAFIAYLIQAFFNISVIVVAPLFYMIMGFINNEE